MVPITLCIILIILYLRILGILSTCELDHKAQGNLCLFLVYVRSKWKNCQMRESRGLDQFINEPWFNCPWC